MTRKHPMFQQIVNEIVEEIQALRDRRRLGKGSLPKLTASVAKLVRDSAGLRLTKGRKQEASIHKATGHYTGSRYNLTYTYRIHIDRAYEGMIKLGYLRETKKGASDGAVGKFLTRYVATSKLMQKFGSVDPEIISAALPTLDPNRETIIVQKKTYTGKFDERDQEITRKIKLPYVDTDETNQMRHNLARINKVLARNYFDLDVTPEELKEVEAEIREKAKGNDFDLSINLANRTLHRTFNDVDFKHGGRFYGGWWQLVPSKLRSRIVINGKRTKEYDFSGLHPNILYAMERLSFPADPYDDLIKGVTLDDRDDARKVCKKAFNAMLNSNEEMKAQPSGMKLSDYETNWGTLSAAIMERHKLIAHHFYTGIGKELQRMDSDMAEEVMLHFNKIGVPVLPVHDSFVMHQGYEVELQSVMAKAFRGRFDQEIGIGLEYKMPYVEGDGVAVSMDVDDILRGLEGDCHKRLEVFMVAENDEV
jgi:hypothetical protein